MKKGDKKSLSDLTIKEISSILKTIDEQIIDLHKCSSDDFLGLNSDFKKFYNQSKGISDNAHEIFKSLSEVSSSNLFKELQSLYMDLNKIQCQFNLNLNRSTKRLKSIQTLLDQFFIPFKNLKQNLSTLKFLLANLNLNDSKILSHVDEKWVDFVKENNQIIEEYRERCLSCEKNIFNLETEIIITLKELESVLISKAIDLDSILNNIHYGIIFFAEKHEEVKHHIPELTAKTDDNSQNIADIITNLQYQDIIRQKIEHIQKSHKNILNEFDQLNESNTSDSKKQAQLLQKIKDIAGLQAAILVKANKEYQLAIEKITEKFLKIGDEMISITAICNGLNSTQDDSEEFHLVGMLHKLNRSDIVFTNFIDTTKKHSVQIENLNALLFQTTGCINGLTDTSSNFSKVTGSIISHFSQKGNDDPCIKDTISQIKDVFGDIHQFEETIQAVYDNILNNANELTSEVKFFNESIVKNSTVNNAADSIKSILSQLQIKSDRVSHLLDENIIRSNNTTSEIKESIKRIRYYDVFEKTISNIILELKDIYQKLIGVDLDETSKEQNLNPIKELYTMETEHIIHERIVSEGKKDLFDESKHSEDKEINDNSDEIELF